LYFYFISHWKDLLLQTNPFSLKFRHGRLSVITIMIINIQNAVQSTNYSRIKVCTYIILCFNKQWDRVSRSKSAAYNIIRIHLYLCIMLVFLAFLYKRCMHFRFVGIPIIGTYIPTRNADDVCSRIDFLSLLLLIDCRNALRWYHKMTITWLVERIIKIQMNAVGPTSMGQYRWCYNIVFTKYNFILTRTSISKSSESCDIPVG